MPHTKFLRLHEKASILVVDDSPPNLLIMKGILSAQCHVLTASSGEEGLRMARELSPDLILLDVTMPGLSGFEVCRMLKADDQLASIPVIFVTARDEMDDEAQGFEVGAVDYITKPVRPPIVRARVRNHIELKRHRDTLEELSTLDGLTGLFNRRLFDQILATEWSRSSRGNEPLSFILADIDCFKKFNDRYGHLVGDECLKQVARALAATPQRLCDVVCRYGGEEFCAILPATRLEGALKLAEAMRVAVLALEIPHEENASSGFVTVSIGVASIVPTQDQAPASLLQLADRLLYRAKAQGRNRVLGEEFPPK